MLGPFLSLGAITQSVLESPHKSSNCILAPSQALSQASGNLWIGRSLGYVVESCFFTQPGFKFEETEEEDGSDLESDLWGMAGDGETM